jgi:hypothetical protein
VFAKDDHSMLLIEQENKILVHLEVIDIKNDEYAIWDASGQGVSGVSIAVSEGSWKSKLKAVDSCPPTFPLQDAFVMYARTFGLPEPATDGTPMDVWRRIQVELERRPKKKSFFSRLFSA